MDVALRIVTSLPLSRLWNASGELPTTRLQDVGQADIRGLMRNGQVQFVVADVGEKLNWIALARCYEYFKTEVFPHLAEPGEKVALDDFPGNYFYFASVWSNTDDPPLILLERHH